MASHLRQSPDSPVIHTGLFLCRNLSQQNGRLRGAAHTKVPMMQGKGVFARGSCHPCKLHWAALVGKQPFLSHRLHLLFSPEICYYFWFLSFLWVSWDHSWCHPSHCSQLHDVAMASLCCFKENWEGNKILGMLQIKFLPEQSKQWLEALGYRNWWEASSPPTDADAALASQPRWLILSQEPKLLLHMCTRDAASPAVKELFIFFLISSEKSQAAVNPSSFLVLTLFWLSFLRRIWCLSPGCHVVLGMEGSSRATAVPGQPLSWPSTLLSVTDHGCVVEGDAVSVLHFSFMHSYLTLILAAGKNIG